MTGPATLHSYPWKVLRGDYIRAALGAATGIGGLVAVGPGVVGWGFLGVGLLFLYFAIRTGLRQCVTYRLTGTALQRSNKVRLFEGLFARPVQLSWRDLKTVKLRYYSTKRDKTDGWMQLSLRADGARLGIESTIDGFDDIVAQTARAIARNDIEVSDTTLANFAALGVSLSAARDEIAKNAAGTKEGGQG